MHIRCPHCSIALEIVAEGLPEEVTCPSCGTIWQPLPVSDETLSMDYGRLRQIAHYQLIERLGRGAFGEVWKARDTKLDRIAALKIPRPDQFDEATFQQFTREARVAAQLNHRNIVAVHQVDRAGDTIYIDSEFIDGISLRDRLTTKPYEPREAAELCVTLAEALHYAHEAGVVHRDLKPGNVLIDAAGQPHLTDFGLAKRNSDEITVTADGQILGTVAYMSPEQARGKGWLADRRSDIYSLGVMLYEMLVGHRPFKGDVRLLLHQVLHDEPVPPRRLNRGIPRDLETICLAALEKDPARRYQTAQDMADDLGRFLRGEPITRRRAGVLERSWRWSRRNPALTAVGAIAVVAVVAIALAVWSWRAHQPARRTVRLGTEPAGATLVFHPLDPTTGEPQPERAVRPRGVSPVQVRLEPGEYLVVAIPNQPGYSFHEVYRTVPPPGAGLPQPYPHKNWKIVDGAVVELPAVKMPGVGVTSGMVLLEGVERFQIGSATNTEIPVHPRNVPGFWLDPTEVRAGDFLADSPKHVSLQLYGTPPQPTDAMAHVTFDQALAYAEKIGKRLDTEWEYEFAATNRGASAFPWGDNATLLASWPYGAAGTPAWERLPVEPPVFGLYSNVAEWTDSWNNLYPKYVREGLRLPFSTGDYPVVRGGPNSVIEGQPTAKDWLQGPRARTGRPRHDAQPGLGFRCARSKQPRLKPTDFSRVLDE